MVCFALVESGRASTVRAMSWSWPCRVVLFGLQGALGERAGGFDELGIVHGDEGL
jgi:hypothetical protein